MTVKKKIIAVIVYDVIIKQKNSEVFMQTSEPASDSNG